MDDVLYLALGIAVFAGFVGYAAMLKRAWRHDRRPDLRRRRPGGGHLHGRRPAPPGQIL